MIGGRAVRIVVAFLAALTATSCKKERPSPDIADAGVDPGAMTPLLRVAAIVIPNCAVAGCHDAVSKTHAMDLSTPAKIHANWVNVPGFDHCTGMNTPRVVPNDPAASLVMLKIEGNAVCAESQRMPLPPRNALTSGQIAVIRDWIAAGAPGDGTLTPDGGPSDAGPSDAGPSDAGPSDAGPSDAGPSDASVGDDGPATCSKESPCGPGLTCSGTTCGGPWECMAHYDETQAHPCSEEIVKFCGCDGTTFEASVTCPDKPWLHVGSCDDGVSCTAGMVECVEAPPVCPPGEYPSVVGTCWGECAPLDSCRCLYHWMCPELSLNTCLMDTLRCGPNPNLVDAGTP